MKLKVDIKTKRFIFLVFLVLCSCVPVYALAEDDFVVFDDLIEDLQEEDLQEEDLQEDDLQEEIIEDYFEQEDFIEENKEDVAPEEDPVLNDSKIEDMIERLQGSINEDIEISKQSYEILNKSDNTGKDEIEDDFEVEEEPTPTVTPSVTPELTEVIHQESVKQMIVMLVCCGILMGFFMIQRMLD